MTEAASQELPAAGAAPREISMLVRGYRAFELLFAVHAKTAKREATADLRRILTGIVFVALAISMLGFALILGQACAVMLIRERLDWSLSRSIGAVAGGDVALAVILLLLARARFSTPVLAETRETVAKAISVLRG